MKPTENKAMETEKLKALMLGRDLNPAEIDLAFAEYFELIKTNQEAIRLLRDLAELQASTGYKIGPLAWKDIMEDIYKFLEKWDK